MLIGKLFQFENAHIVRGCSTRRGSHSIHGHVIGLDAVELAPAITAQWRDPDLFERLKGQTA